MLKAFVSRGLELKLDEIKYHAQGRDNRIESLTGISGAGSDSEASTLHHMQHLGYSCIQEHSDKIQTHAQSQQLKHIAGLTFLS